MRYEWFIAKRYLRPQGGATFIFHLTLISMIGIALGVASLITVLSVMNGFGNYLRSKMIQVQSHLVMKYNYGGGIENYEALIDEFNQIENVASCSPVIMNWGLLYPGTQVRNQPYFISMIGIDAKRETSVSGLSDNLIAGSLIGLTEEETVPSSEKVGITDLLNKPKQSKRPGIVIGKELASLLYAIPAYETDQVNSNDLFNSVLGNVITLVTLSEDDMSLEQVPVTSNQFVIEGVFESGHYQFDSSLVYISLPAAQRLLGIPNKATDIHFRLHDYTPEATKKTAIDVFAKSREFYSYGFPRTWMDINETFFHALDIEKRTMDYILKIIILVATFNIIATLFMVVTEKTRDIGLLRAIGAGRANIMSIFILLGLIVGSLGVLLGVAGGYGICTFIQWFPIEMPGEGQVYYLRHLPCDMELLDFVWVSIYTMGVSFLASIYPAIRASRFVPVDALRFT